MKTPYASALLLAISAFGCTAITDFDRSKLRDTGTPDEEDGGIICGMDGGLSCDAVCGNGFMEPGETCDPPEMCPKADDCDDGTACTEDKLVGQVSTCNAACEHTPISVCENGDSCCGKGCDSSSDDDCSGSCGDGVTDPGETCDPSSLCPADCNDGNACTVDSLVGSPSTCNVACSYQRITMCIDDDGCCPANCSSLNDSDCPVSCGNGAVEPGETCDPPESCQITCDDGNACTIDSMTGSAANCNVACSSQVITQCENGDGCCPAGCNANTDDDCSTTCGNDAVEPGETCDPLASCPTACDDGSACTIDSLTGSASNCTAACRHQQVTECRAGDGCCPAGCNANNDSDCSRTCMNGVIEPGETCDPPASCRTNCDDGSACTIDTLTGSAANCTAACTYRSITQCTSGDGCCPPGCNNNNDRDCSVTCNNGTIETGETCDPRSSCPASAAACNDGNACTVDMLTGSVANCTATCTRQPITQCRNGDGCCPPGCNANNDNNCSGSCGNGVIEAGETCDPQSTCPATCNDGNACTIDTITGSAANCNLVCARQTISTCTNGDGCCPSGCNANNDNNCSASCGNGVVETGETCDPVSSCPTMASCNDGNACTIDTLTGSRTACTAVCSRVTITACANGDGCCPGGCNANNDNDCSASCGNGVIEAGELCDGNCPTLASCNDGNACTIDSLTGSAMTCTAACARTTISQCANGDGCCPAGCNANNDNNCSASCGNGVVETGETCDGNCPTLASCNDGNACTIDSLTGSACTATCARTTINQCANGDGCCPAGCNANTDNNCSASCGNGVVESGETCDGNCPTLASCNDGNACTVDSLTGSACTAECARATITQCMSGDGCCPPGCNNNNDGDCSVSCGNGAIESGETCDPPGSCPTIASCNDSNACTVDSLTGSAAMCTAACSRVTITQCTTGDGCCPMGGTCNIGNDADCTARCGDGVVTAPETCDGNCPTTCPDDGDPCTMDVLTGMASLCNVVCTHPPIAGCMPDGGG